MKVELDPKPGQLYPFEEMKVGDYFDVPRKRWGAVRTAALRYSIRTGKTFKTGELETFVRCMRFD